MQRSAFAIVLSSFLLLTASGCGTAEVQGVTESLEDGAVLDAAEDIKQASDDGSAADAGGKADANVADQCINKFDCLKLDLKGQTPCTVPDCVKGACVFVPLEKGAKCVDPTQPDLAECLETRCDEKAECKALPRPDGAGCAGDGATLDECQSRACKAGKCGITSKPDATLCGIGACKHCKAGKCAIKTAEELNDGNPCTLDSCDVNAGEQHKKITDITAVCDDGDNCTGDGNCLDGKCKAKAIDCNDGIGCTEDSCEKGKGCVHKADTKKCSDDDPCLEIACDLSAGCTTTEINLDEACNDGDDDCTNDDKCDKFGVCKGVPVCGCAKDADCLGKDGKQKNLCKPQKCQLDSSGKGLCIVDLAQQVTCAEDGGACADIGCDPKTGECATTAVNEGKTCDDGNKCTTKPTCTKGECIGTLDESKCDDKNPCTLDSCAADAGCKVEPADGQCDDGNACTENDACNKGGCAGDAKQCDDGVTCTSDVCDAKKGECAYTANAKLCDDGNPCTTDSCDAEGKQSKSKGCSNKPNDTAKCKDDNKCTITKCKSGQCIVDKYDKTIAGCACTSDKACDDQNPCTVDTCAAGDCKNDAAAMNSKPCATGNVCHQANSGQCKAGACTGGKPKDCSSVADKCHTAACNNKSGACEKVAKPDKTKCDADGNKCTVGDACQAGKCKPGPAKSCGDGDQCNLPVCKKADGKCGKQPKKAGTQCEDNNICTEKDTCDGKGACKPGAAKNCSGSADQCNKGVCDAELGCTAISKGANVKCDDKQFCTKTDVCKEQTVGTKKVGKCVGSGVPDCKADPNKCQVAFCDSKANKCAIKPAAVGAPCSDGNACTLTDKCASGGTCKPGPKKTCVGDQCNNPTCSAKTGACGKTPKAAGTKCNDNNACTQTDTCSSGKCVGGNPVKCSGDQCNNPTCDKTSGECGTLPKKDGTACSDGQACTSPDLCKSGSCIAGLWTCGCKTDSDCDDKNQCTTNRCLKDKYGKFGCVKTVKTGALCNDGLKCTLSDKCLSNASCKGTLRNCNDKNQCTADSCTPSTGSCAHKILTGYSCSDGNLCTYSDKCTSKKTCVGVKRVCNDGNVCTNDACDLKTGKCLYNANTNSCTDNNFCTIGDKCSAKVCKSGALKSCSDGTKCTTDVCDPKSGKCSNPANVKLNNYTCEKGAASRCANGKCLCVHWTKSIGVSNSAYYEYMYDVASHGDYTVSVGYRRFYNTYVKKYYYYGLVSKKDRWGNNIWEKIYSYGDSTRFRGLYAVTRNTKDNRWVAVGATYVSSTYDTDGWVIEFDDNGKLTRNTVHRPLAESYFKGKKYDIFRDVVMDKYGEFYAVGYTTSAVFTGRGNAWIYKLKKYGTSSFSAVWSRIKLDLTYTNSYSGVAYNSTYNKAVAVGYTYTKSNSQDGLTTLWDAAGKSPVHRTYGDSLSSQYFNRVASYSTYFMAVGNKNVSGKSLQGWMLSGFFSNGSKYQEGMHGDTGADSFMDITCPSSICYTMGRAYDVKAKKYKLWIRRHYFRYAISAYNNTYITTPTLPSLTGVAYRNSAEIAVSGGYGNDGSLLQTAYNAYYTCK